jgi:predicted nucleic acid-binding protein
VIVLDASVLIAFLDAGNVHHDSARDVIALPDAFGVHTLTLAETLVGGVRADRFDEMATAIAAVGIQELDRLPAEPRTLARLRVETGLKLPDCCVLALAEGHAARLATYDRRLAGVARQRGCDVVGAS